MQELCVQGLVKVYGGRRGEKRALGGVSFTLGPGFYGLLGPNGAGKSTMINIIIGNLAATKGKVLWNGRDVRRLGRQFRAVLGYMPQQQSLYDSFTGRRFLQYMAALKELPRAGVPAEVQRVARAVHLQAELEKKLAAYSGGMKQRLLAAAALLGSPQLLILDEPTASCIYTQKENKKIRKPQAADQTAFIFARLAAARLFSINSIRRLCWS